MRKKYRKRVIVEKEILENLYIDKQYSISMIERELNISRSNIEYCFKLYNINKKTISEIQKSPLVKMLSEKTCLERHGVKAGFADDKKRKFTKLKRYGDENYCNVKKTKETCLSRYGKISYLITDDCKTNLLKKYDVSTNIFQSNIIKEKSKETKLERHGDENYNNREKAKETCLKNNGCEYPMQNSEILEKNFDTIFKKYGVKNAFLLDISIKRARQKMNEIYGVNYGFQSLDIQKTIFKNLFKLKKYLFPSGKIIYVLGYENYMLDILLNNGIKEYDILTNHECPIINWIDNNIEHKHIPDIYIKSLNKIIEVKSEWTSRKECLEQILLKKHYAELQGFEYVINVIDKKTKKILYEINSNKN